MTVVPGLAVRTFVEPAVVQLSAAGHQVDLLPAPTWRGVPSDLEAYGRWTADRISASGRPVDLLIRLSVGTQAAAVAAGLADVRQLLLVSPTVQPDRRGRARILATWLRGDRHPDSPSLREQGPDWARAGVRRIHRGIVSATRVALEDVIVDVAAPVTVVHAGWDNLTGYGFEARLAAQCGGTIIELPDAPHSWPVGDASRFVEVASGVGLCGRC